MVSLQGISLPAAQSFLNYLALALVFGGQLFFKKQPLQAASYKFAGLAAIDVTANFCLVEAFNFTSLTSVTLLDCWTVPSKSPASTDLPAPSRDVHGNLLLLLLCLF